MTNDENWMEKVKALRAEGSFDKTMSYLNELLTARPMDSVVHYQIAWPSRGDASAGARAFFG